MSGTLKVIVMIASMVCLSACTNTPAKQNLVAQAYDSSGTLSGMAYKRSIFSTTDF